MDYIYQKFLAYLIRVNFRKNYHFYLLWEYLLSIFNTTFSHQHFIIIFMLLNLPKMGYLIRFFIFIIFLDFIHYYYWIEKNIF